jgi:hypothetical protein
MVLGNKISTVKKTLLTNFFISIELIQSNRRSFSSLYFFQNNLGKGGTMCPLLSL